MPRKNEPEQNEEQPKGLIIDGRATRRNVTLRKRPVVRLEDQEQPRRRPERRDPEDEPARAKRGCWSTCALYSGLSLVILTLVFAVMAVAFTQEVTDFLDEPWNRISELLGFTGNATPEVTDTKVIVLGIQKMSFLETTRGDIMIEKTVVQEKTFVLKDASLHIRYIGRVTAGIDLSLITESDVILNPDNSLTVNMPPAQISGCYLQDPEILDSGCGTSFLGMADCDATLDQLQEVAYDRALVDLLETTQELELLNTAYENAEDSVAAFLNTLGYRDEQIEFRRSSEVLPPDESCIS